MVSFQFLTYKGYLWSQFWNLFQNFMEITTRGNILILKITYLDLVLHRACIPLSKKVFWAILKIIHINDQCQYSKEDHETKLQLGLHLPVHLTTRNHLLCVCCKKIKLQQDFLSKLGVPISCLWSKLKMRCKTRNWCMM